jgi:hypothetical protein
MDIKGSRDIGDRFAFYDKPSSQLFLIHAKRVFEKSDSAIEAGPCWKTMSGTTRI